MAVETGQWVALAVAALTGGFARDIIGWVRSLFRGRPQRRGEMERAWEKADEESRRRRLAEEHASHLRRLLLEAPCIPSHEVPPFPSYSQARRNDS